jgi:glycosyltransferase involved in cell wall biosynthesis
MSRTHDRVPQLEPLNGIDVYVIARHQKMKPHLGISRCIEELVEVLQYLNLKVCVVSEGLDVEVVHIGDKLVQISLPKNRGVLMAMWRLRLPHPIAAWLQRLEDNLDFSGRIIVPVVSLQSFMCTRLSTSSAKKIVTLHSPYSKLNPLGAVLFYLQKSSLNYADYIVANSATISEKFAILGDMKLNIIPHHVQTNSGAKIVRCDFQNHAMRFIWVGSLSYRKGIDRLIRLLLLNAKRNQIDVVWTKTRYSFLYVVCLKILSRIGWVKLHNNIEQCNLMNLIQNANGLVSTSRFESFGMVIVESALEKKALVGISAPGVIETLPASSGGAAYFKNVIEMNRFLKSVEKSDLDLMGLSAYSYCKKKYGLQEISTMWKKLIGSL